MRGFQEAYERLRWAINNPPSPERLKQIEDERRADEHRAKLKRLRRGVV